MTAALQVYEHRRALSPDDVIGRHVNFARYYTFVGEAFQRWYDAMGINGGQHPVIVPFMVHGELDFLAEMHYPGAMLCRLTVVRIGRSSLTHHVEIFDGERNDNPNARGSFVNSCRDRATLTSAAWPADVLAMCWSAD